MSRRDQPSFTLHHSRCVYGVMLISCSSRIKYQRQRINGKNCCASTTMAGDASRRTTPKSLANNGSTRPKPRLRQRCFGIFIKANSDPNPQGHGSFLRWFYASYALLYTVCLKFPGVLSCFIMFYQSCNLHNQCYTQNRYETKNEKRRAGLRLMRKVKKADENALLQPMDLR